MGSGLDSFHAHINLIHNNKYHVIHDNDNKTESQTLLNKIHYQGIINVSERVSRNHTDLVAGVLDAIYPLPAAILFI